MCVCEYGVGMCNIAAIPLPYAESELQIFEY